MDDTDKYLCGKETQHCGACPACARNAKKNGPGADYGSARARLKAKIVEWQDEVKNNPGNLTNWELNMFLGDINCLAKALTYLV